MLYVIRPEYHKPTDEYPWRGRILYIESVANQHLQNRPANITIYIVLVSDCSLVVRLIALCISSLRLYVDGRTQVSSVSSPFFPRYILVVWCWHGASVKAGTRQYTQYNNIIICFGSSEFDHTVTSF